MTSDEAARCLGFLQSRWPQWEPDRDVWWNAALETCDVVTARQVVKTLQTPDLQPPTPADFNRAVTAHREQLDTAVAVEALREHPSRVGWISTGKAGVAVARAALRREQD